MKYIVWFLSLVISFAGFYVIEHLFTIPPDKVSGNGNLGLLMILIGSPFFITSLVLTFNMIRTLFKNSTTKIIVCLGSIAILCGIILTSFLFQNIHELVTALGGTPTNPNSKIYRFGWFNQYTNRMYFNNYSFLLTHILSIMAGLLACIRKPSDL
ncbi:hypothetical protein [Paenibacillus sp. RC67]|uniref:hypothetical protein n=1 Tax=Paenibacillus sp. RC67 TaxID=3039392 RepID=UPI0024ACB266|nr:hypothetical protein [Paenibacillus sp. RC67]